MRLYLQGGHHHRSGKPHRPQWEDLVNLATATWRSNDDLVAIFHSAELDHDRPIIAYRNGASPRPVSCSAW